MLDVVDVSAIHYWHIIVMVVNFLLYCEAINLLVVDLSNLLNPDVM